MCLIEKETNTKEAMRAGGKMTLVRIISSSSEMIGIGRLMLPSETEGLTTAARLLIKKIQAIHYHIITQCWVLTGKSIVCLHVSILEFG